MSGGTIPDRFNVIVVYRDRPAVDLGWCDEVSARDAYQDQSRRFRDVVQVSGVFLVRETDQQSVPPPGGGA